MTTDEIKVGDTLYVYDEWYRGGVTTLERERAKYRPHVITGETAGKWVLRVGDFNKRTLKESGGRRRQAYTASQVEDRLWDGTHRRAIVRLIERASTDQLRAVAAAIGYVAEE